MREIDFTRGAWNPESVERETPCMGFINKKMTQRLTTEGYSEIFLSFYADVFNLRSFEQVAPSI